MTPAGLEAVAEAQPNGEWEAAAQREKVDQLPADLERALRRRKHAMAAFRQLSASQKKQALYWITSAKKDETRKKRIQATVDKLAAA